MEDPIDDHRHRLMVLVEPPRWVRVGDHALHHVVPRNEIAEDGPSALREPGPHLRHLEHVFHPVVQHCLVAWEKRQHGYLTLRPDGQPSDGVGPQAERATDREGDADDGGDERPDRGDFGRGIRSNACSSPRGKNMPVRAM